MPEARIPIRIFKATILSLLINELRIRFISSVNTKRLLGFIQLIWRPVAHISLWSALRGLVGLKFEGTLSPFLFILFGIIPWFCLNAVMNQSCRIILHRRALYVFRQVKPFDIVLSLILIESILISLISLILLVAFWWFGISVQLYHPLYFLTNYCVFVGMLFGLGLIISTAGFFYERLSDLVVLFSRILYIFSGAFYSVSLIPENFRPYFAANPLFQIMEIFRESFQQVSSTKSLTDPVYFFECAALILFVGFSMHFCARKKMMTEINER